MGLFGKKEALVPREEPERAVRLTDLAALSGRSILVVEDDDTVRDLASISLRMHGYAVLAGRDGKDALGICGEHEGPVQLLVTDVVMPGMSGRELARKIEPLRPAMKTLYISGYTDMPSCTTACWMPERPSCKSRSHLMPWRERCGRCWMRRKYPDPGCTLNP